jgi:hypothetical protein
MVNDFEIMFWWMNLMIILLESFSHFTIRSHFFDALCD